MAFGSGMKRLTPTCLALLALTAPAAEAATPDRKVVSPPNFTFEGPGTFAANVSSQNGTPVCAGKAPATYCDHTLIEAKAKGILTVTFEPGDANMDPDPYVYKSDAEGNETGDPLFGAASGAGSPETAQIPVEEPGFFMATVVYFQSAGAGYKATGIFEADMAGPTPGGGLPGPNQLPTAAIRKASKSALSGTAADPDGAITKVEVGILKKSGSKCTEMRANGSFAKVAKCLPSKLLKAKGTASWSYKPKKALKKGSYLLFARATDGAGGVQAGFAGASRKTLKVR